MTGPLVSVVIPAYKSAYIRESIESVFRQTYSNLEILVIDDGSPHGIDMVLADWIKQGRIRYFRQANKKMGAAKNYGVREARGDLIAFIDDDDTWRPEKVALQVERFANPETALVYTWAKAERGGRLVDLPYSSVVFAGDVTDRLLAANFIKNSTAMVRKKCVQAVGGFNEGEHWFGVDDIDLWLRLSQHYRFDVVPETLGIIRLHEGNFSNNALLMLDNVEYVYRYYYKLWNTPADIRNAFIANLWFERGFIYSSRDPLRALMMFVRSFWTKPDVRNVMAIAKLAVPRGLKVVLSKEDNRIEEDVMSSIKGVQIER
jgi:glycosyltransferase involved in cell wall biosynthesis